MYFVPQPIDPSAAGWLPAARERRWPLWVGAWVAVLVSLALWAGLAALGVLLWRGLFG
jgi:hypothetical protein